MNDENHATGLSALTEVLCRETETIDRLFLELSQFTKARTAREKQLDDLLYAVQRKFPGETRFDTALRYIKRMEKPNDCAEARPDGHNAQLQGPGGSLPGPAASES